MAQTAERLRPRRKDDLVRAAARLFSERGYHGTSMQHLGEALGLQRSSLYAHIGSKEELLRDVVLEGAEAFLGRAGAVAEGPGSATERLGALLCAHIETVVGHLEAATVFLNEWRYLSDGHRAEVKALRDRYEGIFRAVIEDGIAAGEFRADLNPRHAAKLVLSAANWTYTWFRPGGELSAEDAGRTFADMIVRGFQQRGDER